MSNKKILIIHDRFKFKGGAERLVLVMAQALQADILTEYWDEENSFAKSEAPGKVITLGKQTKIRGLGYVTAQWNFFWRTKFIKDYDVIIFSGNNCLSAAWRCKKSQRKIMYCHTPVRYAYDLKDYYYKTYSFDLKPIFLFFVYLARVIYQWGIKKMDLVLANSKNVQMRLKFYCNIDSEVVYPPIDLEKFQLAMYAGAEMARKGGYYLSFGRLDPLKRVIAIGTQPLLGDNISSPHTFSFFLFAINRIIQENADAEILIKLHPRDQLSYYREIIHSSNVHIHQSVPIKDVLFACDIFITLNSTTALEALMMKKPVIIINKDGMEKNSYVDARAALEIRSLDDTKKIAGWLENKKVRDSLEEHAQKFIERNLYKMDGNSSGRIIQLMERMLHHRAKKPFLL